MDGPRFTMEHDTPSYTDFVAYLDPANMRAIHEHFRPYARQGDYADELWQKGIQQVMKFLDQALYELPR